MFIKLKRKNKSEQNDESATEDKKLAVKKTQSFAIVMSLVFLTLGFIVTVNVKRYIDETKSNLPTSRRLDELVLVLKETQNKKIELQTQLQDIKLKLKKISTTQKTEVVSSQLKNIYEQAGLLESQGQGVEVLINSPTVTSDDLLKLVNELKAGGAKAISINGERLVTTSEIVNAGENVVVNKTKVLLPFSVKAIGPIETIIPTLRLRGGIVEYFEVLGVNLDIKEKQTLKIPPYKHEI